LDLTKPTRIAIIHNAVSADGVGTRVEKAAHLGFDLQQGKLSNPHERKVAASKLRRLRMWGD
jgi:hypothetical protein